MQDIELDELEVHLYNQIFHSVPDESEQKLPETSSNNIPNSQENSSNLLIHPEVSTYFYNKNKNRYWTEKNQQINIVRHIINDLVPQISNENENKTTPVPETPTNLENTRTIVPINETVTPLIQPFIPLDRPATPENNTDNINNDCRETNKNNTKKQRNKRKRSRNKNKKKDFINPFQNFHAISKSISDNINNYHNHSCVKCVKDSHCKCNTFQAMNCNNLIYQNILPVNQSEPLLNPFNRRITIGLPPIVPPKNKTNETVEKEENNDSQKVIISENINCPKIKNTIENKVIKPVVVVISDDDESDDSVEIIPEKPFPVVVLHDSDSEDENNTDDKKYTNSFTLNNTETLNVDLNDSLEIIEESTLKENPDNTIIIEETPTKPDNNIKDTQDGPAILTETERFEMLQTPDSSVNDFIDNDITVDRQFNFNLHGSDLDLTEKEFLKPSKVSNTDIYETESSCSGTGTPTKSTFNIPHNTPIKEIFQEPDLVSFSNFITPNRDKGVKRKNTELEQIKTKASDKLSTKLNEADSDKIKKSKKKDKNKNKDNNENLDQYNEFINTITNEVSESKDKKNKNKEEIDKDSKVPESKEKKSKNKEEFIIDTPKKNPESKDRKTKNKEESNNDTPKKISELKDKKNRNEDFNDKTIETKEIEFDSNENINKDFLYEKRKKALDKQLEKKKKYLLKKKYDLDEKDYNKKLEKVIQNHKQRLGKLELKKKIHQETWPDDDDELEHSDFNNSCNISTIDLDQTVTSLDQTETNIDNIPVKNKEDRINIEKNKSADDKIIFADDDNSCTFINDEPDDNVECNDIILNVDNKQRNQKNFIFDNMPSTSKGSSEDYPSFKKKFRDFWTPDMKTFYDESWGEEYFNIDEVMKSMSSDSSKWKICDEDKYMYTIKRKYCVFCKKTGHIKYDCPQYHKKDVKCSTCGRQGHFHMRCPNLLCTSCGHKGGYFTTSCNKCAYFSNIQCYVCKMVGHPGNLCPDLWRRYHLTTSENLVPSMTTTKLKPTNEQWCSGCARRGHLHHNCSRITREYFPTLPNIVSYEPSYVDKPIPSLFHAPVNPPDKIPYLNDVSLENLTKYKNTIVNNNSKKFLFVIRSLIRRCQKEPARQFLHQVKCLERDILENRFDSKKINLMYKLKSTICKLF